ncbi:hypothetical protein LSH36_873g00015 [Paralvinella palmiformis]|uniref:Uncharacterized protein n=1 Tax=Paralvinella palmiformis TaxID=53620 RepID=A0AAD9MRK4_9ANNE|nr:hypothetical protein LSH36_873g00015 [Paralvinella palmiformis]
MDGRNTYILVKVDKQSDNESDNYSFLLEDIDTLHPNVSEKLKRLQDSAPHDRRRERGRMTWGAMRAMTRVSSRISKSRDNPRRSSRDVSKS